MSDDYPALLRYMEHADPTMWHYIAWNWHWDNGMMPLTWMIRQPTCDQGTALMIYWVGGPRWYAQFQSRDEISEYHLDTYDLVKEIEQRYLAGYYTHHQIAFDPTDHEGTNWVREYDDLPLKQPLPHQMFAPTPGVALQRIWLEDGFPQEVLDASDSPGDG
jgi:Domain of unknown function (DUF4274)